MPFGQQRLRHDPADAAGGACQQYDAGLGRHGGTSGFFQAYWLPAAIVEYARRRQGEAMAALRIYGIARTRVFRALWMAKELGLDYDHVPVEIGAAGARQPDFLKINPDGRLPAIDDGGFVLFESLAITLYLAKEHAGRGLYPDTLEGEARAWQ
jgi:hypothetical protein